MTHDDALLITWAVSNGWTVERGGGQIALIDPTGTDFVLPLDREQMPIIDEWCRDQMRRDRAARLGRA